MNRQPFQKPPRWWSPRPSLFWVRFWRPWRVRQQRRDHQVTEVEIRGGQHWSSALAKGHGILLTPNHPGHADSYVLYAVADQHRCALYFMTAWQVFAMSKPVERMVLRQHGCFSVDREGADRQAMAQAVEVLRSGPFPLVIFPEGEVYHLNDRVTPFREGAASIAFLAAKKASRPIVCIPCALKYKYTLDPTPALVQLMSRLEEKVFWRPRPELSLADRIYRFAEGALALKEIEYVGHTSRGGLAERTKALGEVVLGQLEAKHEVPGMGKTLPERAKSLRKALIQKLGSHNGNVEAERVLRHDMDDVFFVVQLYSYPGDYVAEKPSVERLAETLDKFEEDVLGEPTARVRGTRRAIVSLGEPIPVEAARGKDAAVELTLRLESEVQRLLDEIG